MAASDRCTVTIRESAFVCSSSARCELDAAISVDAAGLQLLLDSLTMAYPTSHELFKLFIKV